MSINKKDLPFEVEDHVVLRRTLLFPGALPDESGRMFPSTVAQVYPVLMAGTHGMVKAVATTEGKRGIRVLFGNSYYWFVEPEHELELYRRSTHSPRREEHDKRRGRGPKADR